VLILSIDGLRPDGLQQAQTPNLDALARRGAYTLQAQTVFPPVTLPAHASMLSGYPPGVHGLTWNDYEPARGTITVPTLFSLARAAGLRTVMVVGKEKFAHLNAPGTVDAYVFATNGDQDVADQALAQMASGFDLMVVHLPNTDFFGHSTGWMSRTYLAQLSRTDEAVGRLLDACPDCPGGQPGQSRALSEGTTVILTADHGGHGTVHGANIPEDMTIPWIIAGPGVLRDHPLAAPVSVMDTAATAAYILGLSLPPEASGRPVYEAFGETAPTLLAGRWSEGAPQTPARSELPAAVLGDRIYVPGGFGGETVFQAYDPATDRWIDLARLPVGLHHLMTAASGGNVYVFGGGAAGTWNPSATALAYDPALDAWRSLTPMPEPRMSGAAVALGSKIYIVGGVGGSNALLEYDPLTDAWRSLAALAQPRDHLAAAALNGEIYALGGRWPGVGELDSIEIYSPATNTWRAGPPLLQPHAGFSAAVLHHHLVAAGGEIIINGNETLAVLEVYDAQTRTWSRGPDLPHPIHGVAAAAAGGRFYLLGGSSRAGAIENFGRVMIYTP
jgi:N-acetylneuraminic acid mutarotase